MFRYADSYDSEPREDDGDQVDDMDIALDVVDEFDGQHVDTEGWRFLSQSNIYQGYP